MTWPYHPRNGQTAATAWPPPTLAHHRPAHMDHDDSLGVHAPPGRTRDERYASEVATIRAAQQARRDTWREMAGSLGRIKAEGLWEGRGHASFDAWAWATLRLNSRSVSALLGVAAEPIGGTGRPKPGRPPRAGARTRAQGQVAEVEVLPRTGSTSTSPSTGGAVAATEAAAGRGRLGWAARQLGQIERNGVARWRAGLTDAERTVAAREFAGLSDLFACCARAASGPDAPDAGPGDD